MLELPNFSTLSISQDTTPASEANFAALDHLAIVVPDKPMPALLQSLPQGAQLKAAFDRAGGKKPVAGRLDNGRATGVTLAPIEAGGPHAELSWARRLLADCLREQPAKLGVMTAGLDAAQRERALLAVAAAAAAAAFRLPSFKTTDERDRPLRSLQLFAPKPRLRLQETRAQALGNNIARWFTALPANELTASSYRRAAEQLAGQYGLGHEFYGETRLRNLKAGAFLAVCQGNAERDAGILQLKYRPDKKNTPELALVGKGILFDTGGTNLKPFKGMLDMHTDMQGSAVALGCLIALATLKVPYAIDAWLAITENRMSATAYKSQDVVVASNGTSIQVVHTDAEGRMVLADTLALAAKKKPKLMIDFATLTGSCIAALTNRYSGVFSNRDGAGPILIRAGVQSGERVWPFPMDDDYDSSLRSDVADIKQCAADGYGDHILAARFLQRFVPQAIPWIHVDLSAGENKGGLAHVPTAITGFGVRLILELLRRETGSPAELAAKISA